MKAIYEFSAPEVCAVCRFCSDIYSKVARCELVRDDDGIPLEFDDCLNNRAPFCPLKIVQDNEPRLEKAGETE